MIRATPTPGQYSRNAALTYAKHWWHLSPFKPTMSLNYHWTLRWLTAGCQMQWCMAHRAVGPLTALILMVSTTLCDSCLWNGTSPSLQYIHVARWLVENYWIRLFADSRLNVNINIKGCESKIWWFIDDPNWYLEATRGSRPLQSPYDWLGLFIELKLDCNGEEGEV